MSYVVISFCRDVHYMFDLDHRESEDFLDHALDRHSATYGPFATRVEACNFATRPGCYGHVLQLQEPV